MSYRIVVAVALTAATMGGWVAPSTGQDIGPVTDAISEAFQGADVSKLLEHSSSRIAVAVFGSAREYSRQQAVYVLKDFFDRYPPSDFRYRDASKAGRGQFLEGTYRSTSSDEPMDVYLQLRSRKNVWELREIIIRDHRD